MQRECAIPMCGHEDEGERLVPCCENGHFLHQSCRMSLLDQSCPMCRSEAVKSMLQSATLPVGVLSQTPYSLFGAAVAMYIGKIEHERFA